MQQNMIKYDVCEPCVLLLGSLVLMDFIICIHMSLSVFDKKK